MTTWAYPDHSMHPWFRAPSLKRKPSEEDDDGPASQTPSTRSPIPPKRRRCDVLEHGIAQLSLNHATAGRAYAAKAPASHSPLVESPIRDVPFHTAGPPAAPPEWTPSYTFVSRPLSGAVQPASVEEPSSPEQVNDVLVADDVHDVTMSTPSWYELEKDRIVVTNLSDSEDEAEDESGKYIIPESVIRHFSKKTLEGIDVGPSPTPTNALVLYRPLPQPGDSAETEAEEKTEQSQVCSPIQTDTVMTDDDAMDIEPL